MRALTWTNASRTSSGMQSSSQSQPPMASARRCHCSWTLTRPSATSSPRAITRKNVASVRASWRAPPPPRRPLGGGSGGGGVRPSVPGRTEEGGELVQRLVEPGRVAPGAEQLERVPAAVEPRLRASGDAVAGEQREDVVAVLALRGGDVHLEPIAETEQRLRAITVGNRPGDRG